MIRHSLLFRWALLGALGSTFLTAQFGWAEVNTCDNKPLTTDGNLIADYYDATAGLEEKALKARLSRIASKNASKCTYKEVWKALHYTDEDPSNRNNVVLFYTGRSSAKTDKYQRGRAPDNWTREHIWPTSHGFKKPMSNPAYSDLHHLRPADKSVNSDRNDRDYDLSGQAHEEATGNNWDDDSWEPRDGIKGDAARMIFYMAVRYEGNDPFVPDLVLVDKMTESGCPRLGRLCTLLRWNLDDPVDDRERERHRRVVQIQGNRNPFIDRPEFAERIWGSKCKG